MLNDDEMKILGALIYFGCGTAMALSRARQRHRRDWSSISLDCGGTRCPGTSSIGKSGVKDFTDVIVTTTRNSVNHC